MFEKNWWETDLIGIWILHFPKRQSKFEEHPKEKKKHLCHAFPSISSQVALAKL